MTPEQVQALCLEARIRTFNRVRIGADATWLDEWQAGSALGRGPLSIEPNAYELKWLHFHSLYSKLNGPNGIVTGKLWSFWRHGTHAYESFPMRIQHHDWRICVYNDRSGMFCQWRAKGSDIWNDQTRWPSHDNQLADYGLPREVLWKLWPREQATVQGLLGFNPLPKIIVPPEDRPKVKTKSKRKTKRAIKIRASVRTKTRIASLL